MLSAIGLDHELAQGAVILSLGKDITEEDIDYANRLLTAGVPVELHVYPGAFHAFAIHPTARVARAARRDSQAALARFLGK